MHALIFFEIKCKTILGVSFSLFLSLYTKIDNTIDWYTHITDDLHCQLMYDSRLESIFKVPIPSLSQILSFFVVLRFVCLLLWKWQRWLSTIPLECPQIPRDHKIHRILKLGTKIWTADVPRQQRMLQTTRPPLFLVKHTTQAWKDKVPQQKKSNFTQKITLTIFRVYVAF